MATPPVPLSLTHWLLRGLTSAVRTKYTTLANQFCLRVLFILIN